MPGPNDVTIFNIFAGNAAEANSATLQVGANQDISLTSDDFSAHQKALMTIANQQLEGDVGQSLKNAANLFFQELAPRCTSSQEAAQLACFLGVTASAIKTSRIPADQQLKAFTDTFIADLRYFSTQEEYSKNSVAILLDLLLFDYCRSEYLDLDNYLHKTIDEGRAVRDTARTAIRNMILTGLRANEEAQTVYFIDDEAIKEKFADSNQPHWNTIVSNTHQLLKQFFIADSKEEYTEAKKRAEGWLKKILSQNDPSSDSLLAELFIESALWREVISAQPSSLLHLKKSTSVHNYLLQAMQRTLATAKANRQPVSISNASAQVARDFLQVNRVRQESEIPVSKEETEAAVKATASFIERQVIDQRDESLGNLFSNDKIWREAILATPPLVKRLLDNQQFRTRLIRDLTRVLKPDNEKFKKFNKLSAAQQSTAPESAKPFVTLTEAIAQVLRGDDARVTTDNNLSENLKHTSDLIFHAIFPLSGDLFLTSATWRTFILHIDMFQQSSPLFLKRELTFDETTQRESFTRDLTFDETNKKIVLQKYNDFCPSVEEELSQAPERLVLFDLLLALYGKNSAFTKQFFDQIGKDDDALRTLNKALNALSPVHRTQLFAETTLAHDLIPLRGKLDAANRAAAAAFIEDLGNNAFSVFDDNLDDLIEQHLVGAPSSNEIQKLLNVSSERFAALTTEQFDIALAVYNTTLPDDKKQAIARSLAGIFEEPENPARYNTAFAAAGTYQPTLDEIFSLLLKSINKQIHPSFDSLSNFLAQLSPSLFRSICPKTDIKLLNDLLLAKSLRYSNFSQTERLSTLSQSLKINLLEIYLDPKISDEEKQSVTAAISGLLQTDRAHHEAKLNDYYISALQQQHSVTQKALALFLRDRISTPRDITDLINTTPPHLLIQVLSHSGLNLNETQINQLLAKLGEVNPHQPKRINGQLNWPGNLLRALRDKLQAEHHVGTMNFDLIAFAMEFYIKHSEDNTPPTAEAFKNSPDYSQAQKDTYAALESDNQRIAFFDRLREGWIRNLTREERKIALAVIDQDRETALREVKPVDLSHNEMVRIIWENRDKPNDEIQLKINTAKNQKRADAVTTLKREKLEMRSRVKAHDWFFNGGYDLIDAMPDTPAPSDIGNSAKFDQKITPILRLLEQNHLVRKSGKSTKGELTTQDSNDAAAVLAIKTAVQQKDSAAILASIQAFLNIAQERKPYWQKDKDLDIKKELTTLRAIQRELTKPSFQNLSGNQKSDALKLLLDNPTDSYNGLSADQAIETLKTELYWYSVARNESIRDASYWRAQNLLYVRDTNPRAYPLWSLHDEAELTLLLYFAQSKNKNAEQISLALLEYCQKFYAMRNFNTDWTTNDDHFKAQQAVLTAIRDTANLFAANASYTTICAAVQQVIKELAVMAGTTPAAAACKQSLISALAATANDELRQQFAPSDQEHDKIRQFNIWQRGGQYVLAKGSWARRLKQLSRLYPWNWSSTARADIAAKLNAQVFDAKKISAIVSVNPEEYAAKALIESPYREMLAADPDALFEVISAGLAVDNDELRGHILSSVVIEPLYEVVKAHLNNLYGNRTEYQQFALRHFDCVKELNPKNTSPVPSEAYHFFTALRHLVAVGESEHIMQQIRTDSGLQQRLLDPVLMELHTSFTDKQHTAYVHDLFALLMNTDDLAAHRQNDGEHLDDLYKKLSDIANNVHHKKSLALLYPEWYTNMGKEDTTRPEAAKKMFFDHLVGLLTAHDPQELAQNQSIIMEFKDNNLFKKYLEKVLENSENKAQLAFLMPHLIPAETEGEKQDILLQGINYATYQLGRNTFAQLLSEGSSFGMERRKAFESWLTTAQADDLSTAVALIGAMVNDQAINLRQYEQERRIDAASSYLPSQELEQIIYSIRKAMPEKEEAGQGISVKANLTMHCLAILLQKDNIEKRLLALELLAFCQKNSSSLTLQDKIELKLLKVRIEQLHDGFIVGEQADPSLLNFNSTTMDALTAEFDLATEDDAPSPADSASAARRKVVDALAERSARASATSSAPTSTTLVLTTKTEREQATQILEQLKETCAADNFLMKQLGNILARVITNAANSDRRYCGSEVLEEQQRPGHQDVPQLVS